MTSCSDIRSELKAYADGELSGAVHGTVRRHVDGCTSCARELDEIKSLSRRLRELETAMPPAALRSRILADVPAPAADSLPAGARTPWWRLPTFALGAAACALLLFALVGPRAGQFPEDLARVQDEISSRPESAKPTAQALEDTSRRPGPAAASVDIPTTEKSGRAPVTAPKRSETRAARAPEPTDHFARAPAPMPAPIMAPGGAPRLATPRLIEKEVLETAKTPLSEGLSLGKGKSVLAESPAEQPSDGRIVRMRAATKSETAAGLPPAAPSGPPAGGGFGGGVSGGAAAPPAASADLGAQLRAPAGRVEGVTQNAPQMQPLPLERSETIELTVLDVPAAANGIILFAEDEGGKPILPEKRAESGADEMVLYLLIPSDKLESVRAKLSPPGDGGQARTFKDVYSTLGAYQSRNQQERGVRSQMDNSVYFGYAPPRENLQRENSRMRDIGLQSKVLSPDRADAKQRAGGEQNALRQQRTVPASGLRGLANTRAGGRAFDKAQSKKENQEMVRLVVKLRAATRPAPAQRKGKDRE